MWLYHAKLNRFFFHASLLLHELQTQYVRSRTFCPDGDDYGNDDDDDDDNDNDDGYAH
jgi:hypothetical protein